MLLVQLTAAISVVAAGVQAVQELPISRVRQDDFAFRAVRRHLQGRRNVNSTLYDIQAWGSSDTYYMNLTIGTPPQPQIVILDTGSSDFYLIDSTTANCQHGSQEPCIGGSFDRSTSSSYHQIMPGTAINLTYQDGSYARGPFGTDYIGMGTVRISNVPFGLATDEKNTAGPPIGILGLGYPQSQSADNTVGKYATLPQILVQSGVTEAALYSIALTESGDDLTGSVLFGGIDTSRYEGDMIVVNMLPSSPDSNVLDFNTNITAITVYTDNNSATILPSQGSGVVSQPLLALLDTGTSAFTLPSAIAQQLATAAFPYIDQTFRTPCSHRNDNTKVVVEFAKAINITVGMDRWLTPVYDDQMRPVQGKGGAGDMCTLNLNTGSETQAVAGDAVMRNMYTVFDLANGQMGLAKAASSATLDANKVVTAKAGPSAIAKALQQHSAPVVDSQTPPTILPSAVVPTGTFVASTMTSAVGTATGSAAVPVSARPSATAEGAGSKEYPLTTETCILLTLLASITGILLV